MMRLLKWTIRTIAMRYGRASFLYRKICQPNSYEWADFLRLHGEFRHIGKGARINVGAGIPDPWYVSIGDNSAIASCQLIGHNGAIGVLNKAYGTRLDDVGKIDIRENCFIGAGAIVLPGVTIGPNSIVAAGSVVNRDVPPGVVVAGVPAKEVSKTADYVARLERRTRELPWYPLIAQRESDFDPAIEPELRRQRIAFFYGTSS